MSPPPAADGLDPRLVATLDELSGIPAADLRRQADLEADLQLDSLAVVELQMALEEAVGVRIPEPAEPVGVRTLGDLQDLLDAALAAGQPAFPTLRLREHGDELGAESA